MGSIEKKLFEYEIKGSILRFGSGIKMEKHGIDRIV